MNKTALPMVGEADLYFQVLDLKSRKKVLDDLKKGYTINVPNFGGEYGGNTVKKVKWSDVPEKEKTFIEFWRKSNIEPTRVVFTYDEKKRKYIKVDDAPVETKSKMILDPSTFKDYLKTLNLEPIEKVRERFNAQRGIDEATKYLNSGQQDKDMTRLELETGKLDNKNQPGKFLINMEPEYIRKTYGPKNIIDFYENKLQSKGKQAGLAKFNRKMAAASMLQEVAYKLRGFNRYAAVLDEISFNLGVEPRSKTSRKLYELSSKLPADKCASQIKRLKVMAAEAQNPQDIGRVTTKDYKPLAEYIEGHDKGVGTFLKKIEDMAKPNPSDTFKDKMIKDVYKAFIAQMKKHETDTPQEMIEINKGADKLVKEITDATKPVDMLVAMVDRYKRKY